MPEAPPLLPDFLLIGAAKAGTTTFHHLLGQHPRLFTAAIKEPNYFAFPGGEPRYTGPGDDAAYQRIVTERTAYEALFADRPPGHLAGEGSHWYLYSPNAAAHIHRVVPNVRLLVLLRDPADRAFSTYLHLRRTGQETLPTFEAALGAEDERVATNWSWGHYRRRGRYHEQLARYLARFPRTQLWIGFYEDFQADPLATIQDAYRFLGVDAMFVPDLSVRFNKSGLPRSRLLHRMVRAALPLYARMQPMVPGALRRRAQRLYNANLVKPALDPAVRAALIDALRDDILRLQALLDRDLSAWLRV